MSAEKSSNSVPVDQLAAAGVDEAGSAMATSERRHRSDSHAFVRAFVALLALKTPIMADHCRRTADLALRLAKFIGMSDEDANETFFAALVHDVGSIGMPDSTYTRSTNWHRIDERKGFLQHPVAAELLLTPIRSLKGAATLVRSHHERWDGKGFPDKLVRDDTPLGARVIAIADDFDRVQLGLFHGRKLQRPEAIEYLSGGNGSRYDPELTNAFLELLGKRVTAKDKEVVALAVADLRPKMILGRDLEGSGGLLLLSKGFALDEGVIRTLQSYSDSGPEPLIVNVQKASMPTA